MPVEKPKRRATAPKGVQRLKPAAEVKTGRLKLATPLKEGRRRWLRMPVRQVTGLIEARRQ